MGKRANGEGSVFKRADGRWSAEVSYRDEHGQSKRRTVYGATQTEVLAKQRALRERLESGAPVKDTTMTLAAWLDGWIGSSLPASDRKQATIDLYSRVSRTHLAPTLGARQLDRIRPSDVEALIVAERAAGSAPPPFAPSSPSFDPPSTSLCAMASSAEPGSGCPPSGRRAQGRRVPLGRRRPSPPRLATGRALGAVVPTHAGNRIAPR